mmetsp:Transcript_20245/g.24536  ORF Transcript_20245/g.24536 Transcript_20245/m.24536 type:complete len:91 (+) Transcript_20245:163-435(+)|eukprot:CAMPEP_0197311744 /NCGR_PEP_ID=MMETSP0891-20130614/14249_1 /TAXON_ID=44058 ORGANISM="Aureoumbra lagunensis, Strain CCMP1510" /NCGR_SAMPLE_ID=MMETSP0891 /ASSEMBLY_ACC=CAM_ASM_000534 /LENGTH=90 /DNA_ID=CAMNT_0042798259 /DNA_START=172 /DNA_END=444 /DNA_ORIENTATION=-
MIWDLFLFFFFSSWWSKWSGNGRNDGDGSVTIVYTASASSTDILEEVVEISTDDKRGNILGEKLRRSGDDLSDADVGRLTKNESTNEKKF